MRVAAAHDVGILGAERAADERARVSAPCDPTPGERLTIYAVEQMTEGLSKLLGLFGRLGFQTPIIRFVPSSEVAKVYCLNGLGLAFLTTSCVQQPL
jgi:hypothetical protein